MDTFNHMKVAGLLSGGKDSVYASWLIHQGEHRVKHLVSVRSSNPESYMFHTINIGLTRLQAEAWELDYRETNTKGEKEKELADLKTLLSGLDIEGVVSGAIASEYQRNRIDRIATDLGLTHFAPLWGKEREEILEEMLGCGMRVIFSAVAAHGLDQTWLGEPLNKRRVSMLRELGDKYGFDICGEGGEYETLVIDTPWFSKRIKVKKAEKTWDGVSGKYNIQEAHLVAK